MCRGRKAKCDSIESSGTASGRASRKRLIIVFSEAVVRRGVLQTEFAVVKQCRLQSNMRPVIRTKKEACRFTHFASHSNLSLANVSRDKNTQFPKRQKRRSQKRPSFHLLLTFVNEVLFNHFVNIFCIPPCATDFNISCDGLTFKSEYSLFY